MGFHFVQKSMILIELEQPNHYKGRNGRLISVVLTYVLSLSVQSHQSSSNFNSTVLTANLPLSQWRNEFDSTENRTPNRRLNRIMNDTVFLQPRYLYVRQTTVIWSSSSAYRFSMHLYALCLMLVQRNEVSPLKYPKDNTRFHPGDTCVRNETNREPAVTITSRLKYTTFKQSVKTSCLW